MALTHPLPPDSVARRESSRLASVFSVASPSDRLIVALDFADARAALSLLDQLGTAVRWCKIGLELYVAEGNALIAEVRRRGYSVFLDLKLHDIPNTVASAVRSASGLGVQMLTVHASGGPAMLAAAAEAAGEAETGPALLAVTVLTSMDAKQLAATGIEASPGEQVGRLASMAMASGVQGLVCSPIEVEGLRTQLGKEPLLVIPGIRPVGAETGDQRRVATPGSAIASGASYLVVGRPITRAEDPMVAVRSIIAEIAAARP